MFVILFNSIELAQILSVLSSKRGQFQNIFQNRDKMPPIPQAPNEYDCSLQFEERGVDVDVRCRDLLAQAAEGLRLAFQETDSYDMGTIVLVIGGLLVGVTVVGGKNH